MSNDYNEFGTRWISRTAWTELLYALYKISFCLIFLCKNLPNYWQLMPHISPLIYPIDHLFLYVSYTYQWTHVQIFFICTIPYLFYTLTEVFPCFFLSCKANVRVHLAKMGHGPHSSLIVLFHVLIVLFYVLFCVDCVVHVLCLCVNVYCTTATGCQPNCS